MGKTKLLCVIELCKHYTLPRPCSQEAQYLPAVSKVHMVPSDLHSKYPHNETCPIDGTELHKYLEVLPTNSTDRCLTVATFLTSTIDLQ